MKRQLAYVAMSGGVDSSVAAALLKKRGFDVVGVFMKPWQPNIEDYKCLWEEDREDALRVATHLGIPLKTWDFSKEYKREVTDYMVKEYRAGRTPNPDVMCNDRIKFGLFLDKALKEGADSIATGHYIKIKKSKINSDSRLRTGTFDEQNQNYNSKFKISYKLLKAKDKNKDQSYFLWKLTQKQLKYCLFPVGNYTKPEIRKMAQKLGLPTAEKKDSQGVCFIGPLDMKGFLKKYIKPKKGKILNQNHKILGTHDGVYYYTIGQRHGLDIKDGGGPYFVIKKDMKKNIIYVGDKSDLNQKETEIEDISWVNKPIKLPANIQVKIRYRSKSELATMFKSSTSKHLKLKFKKPVRAVASGQSAVFYSGQKMLGGGIIEAI